MSGRFGFTYTQMVVAVVGVVFVVVGGLVAFYAATAVGGDVAPGVVTPLGVFLVALGLILIASKDE